jgi:hypothetical protein
VLPAFRAVFFELDAAWIVAAILFGGVIAIFTLRAGQGDDGSNVLF